MGLKERGYCGGFGGCVECNWADLYFWYFYYSARLFSSCGEIIFGDNKVYVIYQYIFITI